ncbi:MAG: Ldh family oxidoreductase [Candidatus Cloacimonetes bacterium]|nr:Ldh family oxidoreductase [Candidatus Cloacimonadota bacterium]
MADFTKVKVSDLEKFVTECFEKSGMSNEDSKITTDVLIESDKRGIASHGVARLKRYTDGIKNGIMIPDADYEIIKETPNTLVITGNDGLGQPVSYKTMKLVIEKAKKNNIGFATVRNSNHYGIAGYYSMMALQENLLGISTTNSFPLVVPTFGKDALLGTNPISVAAPTSKERPFVVDMATSTVPRGKLEVYDRRGKPIPEAWATDSKGHPTTDPGLVLKNVKEKLGGGLLPVGGVVEETGGHKGYGMAMIVEIFTGILSGGAFGPNVYGIPNTPANVCHFFGAINIEAFISLDEFTKSMDSIIRALLDSKKAEGQDRIYIHGEKEFILADQQQEYVKLFNRVIENIKEVGESLGVEANF